MNTTTSFQAFKEWQNYQDSFSKRYPEMSTHKICLFLDMISQYIYQSHYSKFEAYLTFIQQPMLKISEEEYIQMVKLVCKKLNISIDWNYIDFKIKHCILLEKTEGCKNE